MLHKLLIPFDIVGITTKVTTERSEPCMQEHLFRLLSNPGHNGFLSDVSVTFINKTDPSDPLKRENIWRETPMTVAPFKLNIGDSV